MTDTYTALTAQLQQLQAAIYAHEFGGWLTMSAQDASAYHERLTDCKRLLLAELDAAVTWEEKHSREAVEARIEMEVEQ